MVNRLKGVQKSTPFFFYPMDINLFCWVLLRQFQSQFVKLFPGDFRR